MGKLTIRVVHVHEDVLALALIVGFGVFQWLNLPHTLLAKCLA